MKIVPFVTSACGNTAEEAFQNAVMTAEIDYGKGGNTGTIADKKTFEICRESYTLACFLDNRRKVKEPVVEDPVYCVDLDDGEFIFYGFAQKD